MSVNLVEMVQNQLGGGTLEKVSSFLGESHEKTKFAAGATIPALLAGLTHAASTPEGAQRLSDVAAEHENATTNFGDSISSQGEALASKGSSAFSSLLGGGTASSLTSVLGRFTGLQGSSMSKLVSVCMPLILGVLGKYQRSAGLNAAGLSGFLTSQKPNIAAAMPGGLSSMLSQIPGVSGFAKTPPSDVDDAEKAVFKRRPRGMRPAPGDVQPGTWSVGIAAVIAAVALALWAISNHSRHAQEVAQNPPINEAAGSAAPSTQNVKQGLNETLARLNTTLNGITDANTANKALPDLDQLNIKLADLHSTWKRLPNSAKPAVVSSMQMEPIKNRIAKLRTMPGVGDKLRPVLDQIDSQLSSFNGANPTPTASP